MLANLNDVLPRARREGYAVGLFNTVNLEMARGVLAAAEEARSPVIIGTAEVLLPAASLEEDWGKAFRSWAFCRRRRTIWFFPLSARNWASLAQSA